MQCCANIKFSLFQPEPDHSTREHLVALNIRDSLIQMKLIKHIHDAIRELNQIKRRIPHPLMRLGGISLKEKRTRIDKSQNLDENQMFGITVALAVEKGHRKF